ncbi:MAG: DUF3891 family protein [Leeuwenhoekiella sp.]
MIVNKTNEGWQVIYQHAHGVLAGQIANELSHDLRPDFWVEMLTAIVEHDDNQLNFEEKSYLNDGGLPQDFTEVERSKKENLERAQRVMYTAQCKSGYVALLISMHIEFLYGDLREEQGGFGKFLKEQETLRIKLRAMYNLTKKSAKSYYEILRFCDRCSLILCKNEFPALGRKLEINKSINNSEYYIYRRDDETIGVEPWCFENDTFEVGVEVLQLNKSKFKSNRDLKKTLESSQRIRQEFVFSKK